MHQYLYTSRPAAPFDDRSLLDLLDRARVYNEAHGVTGVLFYYSDEAGEGVFVQYFEGAEAAVRLVRGRIEADPRHTNVETYLDEPREGRLFPSWSMAYAPESAPPRPRAFVHLADLQLPHVTRRETALHFLAAFRDDALTLGPTIV